MKCPACKSDTLIPAFLEDSFRCHTCRNCSGNWLLIEDYMSWLERYKSELINDEINYKFEDSETALICPVTGSFMLKFRINNETSHKLDYSPKVAGVWLDAGEWQYLKDKGLATSLNKIFTDHWQIQLKANNTRATFEQIYTQKFGVDDYNRVKEIRSWLQNKENKAELRAYILAEDPYSV